MRVNRHDGGIGLIPTEGAEWTIHPFGDDVAAFPCVTNRAVVNASFVDSKYLVSEGDETRYVVGDEVFFLGRFVGQDGKERNIPTARFGNISTLPQPIRHEFGYMQESFLVEARSLSGYSGSPVFTWPTIPKFGSKGPPFGLIGIDWCHLRDWKPVMQSDHTTRHPDNLAVEQNSGMMGVVPAWKISQLLEEEHFVADREATAKKIRSSPTNVALDWAESEDV